VSSAEEKTKTNESHPYNQHHELWSDALSEALDQMAVCRSGASTPSRMESARRRFTALLLRQRLPMDAASLRALSDVELHRLSLLAAVGGMDVSWKRAEKPPQQWLIDAHGRLIPAFAPSQVESDVLLCIICALLGALAFPRGVTPLPP
jgi:hypothetical protein